VPGRNRWEELGQLEREVLANGDGDADLPHRSTRPPKPLAPADRQAANISPIISQLIEIGQAYDDAATGLTRHVAFLTPDEDERLTALETAIDAARDRYRDARTSTPVMPAE
jgi:hypothetical protein